MPPDAEPVMPASDVTVMASLTSGLGMDFSASLMTRKPGRAAITPPKPYSEAVFIAASNAPLTAALLPSANGRTQLAGRRRQNGEDAREQRAFHRPDRLDPGNRRGDRAGPAQRQIVARAIDAVDQAAEDAGNPPSNRLTTNTMSSGRKAIRAGPDAWCRPARFVAVAFAVAFARGGGLAAAPFEIESCRRRR